MFGILDVNGNVDVQRTRQLVEAVRPLGVTFHRAFDMTADRVCAREDLCGMGGDQLLTSGGEQTALGGGKAIAQLVRKAVGRIAVMAGSGIRPENAQQLVEQSGVREIHVGLRTELPSPMQHRNAESRWVLPRAGSISATSLWKKTFAG